MRRWLFAFAAFTGLVFGLTGCHHTAGVCDCDEDDWCASRAPWYKMAADHPPGVTNQR